MIKNEINISKDWHKVDMLINKLLFIRDVRFAIHNIKDDWKKEDGDGILQHHYISVDKENIDDYLAEDANRLIIDYVMEESK